MVSRCPGKSAPVRAGHVVRRRHQGGRRPYHTRSARQPPTNKAAPACTAASRDARVEGDGTCAQMIGDEYIKNAVVIHIGHSNTAGPIGRIKPFRLESAVTSA